MVLLLLLLAIIETGTVVTIDWPADDGLGQRRLSDSLVTVGPPPPPPFPEGDDDDMDRRSGLSVRRSCICRSRINGVGTEDDELIIGAIVVTVKLV
uniref:Putative secreted peptide n=1 Tax=Anopheles braziliensis TaxID=58242 RepID=A0A2M3ZQR3_9DIPT